MKRCRVTKTERVIAGAMSGLLFAILALPLSAQPVKRSQPGRGFNFSYKAARETSISGTVQEVVTKHVAGSPAGMHLMINGADGVVDAHVGSLLSKNTREALRVGVPVQIIGAMEQIHGKQYLLARQLTFDGRVVTVRSRNGLLVGVATSRRATSPRAQKIARAEAAKGGAR